MDAQPPHRQGRQVFRHPSSVRVCVCVFVRVLLFLHLLCSRFTPPPHRLVTPLDDDASLWMQWLATDDTATAAATTAPATRRTVHPDAVARWRAAPRVSLKTILARSDSQVEFRWRRRLRGRVDVNALCGAIRGNRDVFGVKQLVLRLGTLGGTTYTRLSASRSRLVTPHHLAFVAMRELDNIAASAPLDIAGRALAVLSLLLWHVAGWGDNNCRSGPAFNKAWAPAFAWLQGGEVREAGAVQRGDRPHAVRTMRRLREQWLHSAHLVGRVARHYERAAQLLVAQSVYTAPVMPPKAAAVVAAADPLVPGSAACAEGIVRVPVDVWVEATAPARVDLAGGWSDTVCTFSCRVVVQACLCCCLTRSSPFIAAARCAATGDVRSATLRRQCHCSRSGFQHV